MKEKDMKRSRTSNRTRTRTSTRSVIDAIKRMNPFLAHSQPFERVREEEEEEEEEEVMLKADCEHEIELDREQHMKGGREEAMEFTEVELTDFELTSSACARERGGNETSTSVGLLKGDGNNTKEFVHSEDDAKQAETSRAYRPEIDGLRAVAVLAVILYHLEPENGGAVPGGYAGVDVFFVISGFLITSIQVSKLQCGTFSLLNFWMRRIRRLFPAMCTMVIGVLLWGNFVLLGGKDFEELAEQSTYVLLSVGNFFFMAQDSYFSKPRQFPLLHCWSLAVEEQYYILFPLVISAVWWIAGSKGRRSFVSIAMVLHVVLVASFFSTIFVNVDEKIKFYMLPFRAFEMAMGGVLSMYNEYGSNLLLRNKWLAELLAWSSMLSIIVPFFQFSKTMEWPSAWTLVPCLGTAAFIWTETAQSTICGRILASRIPVSIGKVSYSLYLWHWPIIVFSSYMYSGIKMNPVQNVYILASNRLSLSFVAGYLSYYTVEQSLRTPKYVSNVVFFPACFVVWATALSVSIAAFTIGFGGVHFSAGPSSWTGSVPNLDLLRTGNCTCPHPGICLPYLNQEERNRLYRIADADANLGVLVNNNNTWQGAKYDYNNFRFWPDGRESNEVDILALGDSHCKMYDPLLEMLVKEYNTSFASLCQKGTQRGGWGLDLRWDRVRLDYMKQWNVSTVILFERYHNFLGLHEYDFEKDIKIMLQHAKRVYVFGDTPTLNGTYAACVKRIGPAAAKKCIYQLYNRNKNLDFLTKIPSDSEGNPEKAMRAAAALYDEVDFLETRNYFVDSETNFISAIDPFSGMPVYYDTDHLSTKGAFRIEQLLRHHLFGDENCMPEL